MSANESPPTRALKVGTMYRVLDVPTAWAAPGSIIETIEVYNRVSDDMQACTARVLFGTIKTRPDEEDFPHDCTRFVSHELEPLNAPEPR